MIEWKHNYGPEVPGYLYCELVRGEYCFYTIDIVGPMKEGGYSLSLNKFWRTCSLSGHGWSTSMMVAVLTPTEFLTHPKDMYSDRANIGFDSVEEAKSGFEKYRQTSKFKELLILDKPEESQFGKVVPLNYTGETGD